MKGSGGRRARVFFILLALLLVFGWLMLTSDRELGHPTTSETPAQSVPHSGSTIQDSGSLVRSELQGQPRFLDKLTRQEIKAESVAVLLNDAVIPQDEWALLSLEEWDRASLQMQPSLDSIPPSSFLPIAAAHCKTEEKGVFLVPYSSRLHVALELADEELIPEVNTLLLNREWVESYRAGRIDRGKETFLPLTSIEHMLKIYQRDHQPDSQGDTPSDDDSPLQPLDWINLTLNTVGEGEALFFFDGVCLISSFSSDYGIHYSFEELVPGQETISRIRLDLRPILRGQLVDEQGKGVPHQSIEAIVSLGSYFEQVEWYGSREQGGMATFGQRGNYQRRVNLPSITDGNGNFSVRVPRGDGYGMHCNVGESFAFDYVLGPFSGAEEVIRLKPQLKGSNLKEGVPVQVLTESGIPAGGVFVELLIADDFPWFRSLPIVSTNAEGRAGFPWIEEGVTVGPGVFLQRDRWAAPVYWRGLAVKLTPQNIPLVLHIPDLDTK